MNTVENWCGINYTEKLYLYNTIILLGDNEILIKLNPETNLLDLFLLINYFTKKDKLNQAFAIFLEEDLITRKKNLPINLFYPLNPENFSTIIKGGKYSAYYTNEADQETVAIELRFSINLNL